MSAGVTNRHQSMSPLPQASFFKYKPDRELEFLRDLILSHRLYCPRAKQLNDPREAKPLLRNLTSKEIARFLLRFTSNTRSGFALHERVAHEKSIEQLASIASTEFREEIKTQLHDMCDGYRILSMSKRWDNLAMWAWYADCHKGYCLEFANKGWIFENAREVIYDDAEMDISADAFTPADILHRKAFDWRSEEEVRVILPSSFPGDQVIAIDPTWLTRLILGEHIPESSANQIRGWAAERTPPLTVVQAQFDTRLQKLVLND